MVAEGPFAGRNTAYADEMEPSLLSTGWMMDRFPAL